MIFWRIIPRCVLQVLVQHRSQVEGYYWVKGYWRERFPAHHRGQRYSSVPGYQVEHRLHWQKQVASLAHSHPTVRKSQHASLANAAIRPPGLAHRSYGRSAYSAESLYCKRNRSDCQFALERKREREPY